jgi:hypothetical protein
MIEEVNRKICKDWGKKWFEIMFFDTRIFEDYFPTKNYFVPDFPDGYMEVSPTDSILTNEAIEFIIMKLYSGRKLEDVKLRESWLSETDIELLNRALDGTLTSQTVEALEEKSLEMIDVRFQLKMVEDQKDQWFGDISEGGKSKKGSDELSIASVSPREHLEKATLNDLGEQVRFTQEYFDSDSETLKSQSQVHSKIDPSRCGDGPTVSPDGETELTLERHQSAAFDIRALSVIEEVTESKRYSMDEEENTKDKDPNIPMVKKKKIKGGRGDQLYTVSGCEKSMKNSFVIGAEAVENMKKKLINYREELRKKEGLKTRVLLPFPALEQVDSGNGNTPISDPQKSVGSYTDVKVKRRPNFINNDLFETPQIDEQHEPPSPS